MKDPWKILMAFFIVFLCLCFITPLEAGEGSLPLKAKGPANYGYGQTESFFLPLIVGEDLLMKFNMEFGSSGNSKWLAYLSREEEIQLPLVLAYAMEYQPQPELVFTLNFHYFPERDQNEDKLKGPVPSGIYPGTFLYEAWDEGRNLPAVYSGRVAWLAEGALITRLNMIYSRWSTVDAVSDPFPASVKGYLPLRDTLGLALGFQYDLNSLMTIYADYIYDPSPYSNWAGFPEDDLGRHILHFGSGFTRSNFRLDLSYSYTLLSSQKVPEEDGPSSELKDREILEVNLQYRF